MVCACNLSPEEADMDRSLGQPQVSVRDLISNQSINQLINHDPEEWGLSLTPHAHASPDPETGL